MIAACTRAFLDTETGELRAEGETFEVTPERLAAINSTKYGQLAVPVVEKPSDTATGPQRPKRTRATRRKPKE